MCPQRKMQIRRSSSRRQRSFCALSLVSPASRSKWRTSGPLLTAPWPHRLNDDCGKRHVAERFTHFLKLKYEAEDPQLRWQVAGACLTSCCRATAFTFREFGTLVSSCFIADQTEPHFALLWKNVLFVFTEYDRNLWSQLYLLICLLFSNFTVTNQSKS